MALARRSAPGPHGYTVDEVARFLQYDCASVRYWLRTGHLVGRQDPHTGDWRVSAAELISFLRQSAEPMPTGVPHHPGPTPTATVPAGMRPAPDWLTSLPDEPSADAGADGAVAGPPRRRPAAT
jgi:hypothetical protein